MRALAHAEVTAGLRTVQASRTTRPRTSPSSFGADGFLLESYNSADTERLVEKTEVEAIDVIVYSRPREVLTDDVERVAVESGDRAITAD